MNKLYLIALGISLLALSVSLVFLFNNEIDKFSEKRNLTQLLKGGELGSYTSPAGIMDEKYEEGKITKEELDKFYETYNNSLYDPLPPPTEQLEIIIPEDYCEENPNSMGCETPYPKTKLAIEND